MIEKDALQGKSLVFVIGVFRSGTSLLHRMLQAHPEVSLMWEADALRFLAGKAKVDWWKRLDEWNGCISRHEIDGESLPPRARREDAALALYFANAKNDSAIRVIGEKSPYYCDVLRRLARDFPLARFVVIHRDPVETLASVRQAAKGNRFFNHSLMPLRVLKDAGRLRKDTRWLSKRGYAVYEIYFEKLVKEPKQTMDSLFRSLGLDPELAIDSGGAEVRNLIPAGEHHHKVLHAKIENTRADTLVADASTRRHLALRNWLYDGGRGGWRLAPHCLVLFSEELVYHWFLALECLKRIAFRNLPLSWICKHRATSDHAVKSLPDSN
jgi:hypothetical protein